MTLVDGMADIVTTLPTENHVRIPGVGPTLPYPVKAAVTRIRSAAWLLRTRGALDTSAPRIIMYHRISDDRDELAVSPRRFRQQMEFLAARGYRVCDVPDVARLLAGGELPERTVGLSFDDGYRDVAENAVPVLAGIRLPRDRLRRHRVTDGRATFAWYEHSRLCSVGTR